MCEGHEYDNRWTIKDKLSQYRGVLALYGRDRENKAKDYQNELQEGFENMCKLKRDIHFLRSSINEQEKGDQHRLRAILQENRRILLAFQNKHPLDIIGNLQQINCIKMKEINKLWHMKKLKMNYLEKIMVDIEEIKKRTKLSFSAQSAIKKQQILIKQIENTTVCHNAAMCLHNAYKKMVALMKEDALYLDHIATIMSKDADEQTQCISDIRIKGEHATAENERVCLELHTLEEETFNAMRSRDRAIRLLHQQINIQSIKLKAIGREESEKQVFRLEMFIGDEVCETYESAPYLLEELEAIIEYLQGVTIVTNHFQIFPRIQEQLEQRDRLKRQLKLCEDKHASLTVKRDHAKELLSFIKHTQSEVGMRHELDEAMLIKQLNEAKTRKGENYLKLEELGKKLFTIRAAVTTLSELLGRIIAFDDNSSQVSIEKETNFEEIICKIENPIKTLEVIKNRAKRMKEEIAAVVAAWPCSDMITERDISEIGSEKHIEEVKALKEMDPSVVDDAKQEYHAKVSEHCSKAHFGETDDYEYRLEDGIDIDTGIITRTDIKLASQRIVKNFERPLIRVSSKKGLNVLCSPKKSPRRRRWLKCH